MGRIANLYDMPKPSRNPKSAQGCVRITLVDDTGAMTVRLWYANTAWGARLKLGMLATVWTVHVSRGGSERVNLAPVAAPLFTTIFPEGEKSCHFAVHEGDEGTMFKRPFGVRESNLMTLKNFIDGGYDVDGCRLLVCVKNIGARKKCGWLVPAVD